MARDQQQDERDPVTTPQRYADTTPPAYQGSDYSFTLQAVMEMQKSVGQLTQAVTTLTEHSKKQSEKLDKISHVIYAAGVVLLIGLTVGGWIVNRVADVAVEMYKHQSQVQQVQTPPAQPEKK